MITRRIVLAGAAALAFTASASAEDWKAKYPEVTFAVVPAENASAELLIIVVRHCPSTIAHPA
jgi:hypothetical protein